MRVTVVRTGGIAGLRREWRAEPPDGDAHRWIELIDRCPWDDPGNSSPGGDRYVWRIDARCDDQPPREAQLSDDQLDGPWRLLIDEVRAAAPRRPRRHR